MLSHASFSVRLFKDSRGLLWSPAVSVSVKEFIWHALASGNWLMGGLIVKALWNHVYMNGEQCAANKIKNDHNTFWIFNSVWFVSQTTGKMCSFQPAFVCHCWSVEDSLIMGLHSAAVCLYECAQRKMNEILIHESKRKLVPQHSFCVHLDVNAKHIVLGHNGFLRSQAEAVMESSLSYRNKQHRESFHPLDLKQVSLVCLWYLLWYLPLFPLFSGSKAISLVINVPLLTSRGWWPERDLIALLRD